VDSSGASQDQDTGVIAESLEKAVTGTAQMQYGRPHNLQRKPQVVLDPCDAPDESTASSDIVAFFCVRTTSSGVLSPSWTAGEWTRRIHDAGRSAVWESACRRAHRPEMPNPERLLGQRDEVLSHEGKRLAEGGSGVNLSRWGCGDSRRRSWP